MDNKLLLDYADIEIVGYLTSRGFTREDISSISNVALVDLLFIILAELIKEKKSLIKKEVKNKWR